MNTPSFVAWRYVQPKYSGKLLSFASAVAFVSVMLGSIALIIALAVLAGFERELRENAVKFTAHIEITGFNKRLLPNSDGTLQTILRTANVRQASPFIAAEAIARSSSFMDGVQVRGIEPTSDVSGVRSAMQQGQFAFSASDGSEPVREVIIGTKLANNLGLALGKKLTLYSIRGELSAGNPPIVEQFRIVGLYETGMSQYDDVYIYIPLATAASIFGVPDGAASGYDILVHDISLVKTTAEQLESALGYPFFVMTVFELYDSMFAWIELQKEPVPLILALISIVAVFNIVATLFMAVVQKMHSIGILRALGMKSRQILRIFLLQGVVLCSAGTVLGCAIAAVLCWVQHTYHVIALQGEIYFLSAVPIEFSVWHYVIVLCVSIASGALAALIPAWIGSRIPLLRALTFQ
jgi:lipoprotein-releasing system permease protein